MKRSAIAIFLLLTFAFSRSDGQPPVRNDRYAGFSISLPVTRFYHKPEEQSTNVGLSAAFFLTLTKRLWIEGEMSSWTKEEVLEDYNYKLRSYAGAVYCDLFSIERINLTPYLGTGLCLFQTGSGTTQSELIYLYYGYFDWDYVFGVLVGGGLRWQFLDNVGFRLDVRDQIGSKLWEYEPDRHLARAALSVVIRSKRN